MVTRTVKKQIVRNPLSTASWILKQKNKLKIIVFTMRVYGGQCLYAKVLHSLRHLSSEAVDNYKQNLHICIEQQRSEDGATFRAFQLSNKANKNQ